MTTFHSLLQLTDYFCTDQICQNYLISQRWGTDVICPYCGKHHCHRGADGRFFCTHCHRKFSAKVGTIFESSKISLKKWYMTLWIFSNHKKGISSCQLAKDIKVTQKTAFYMLQKIRSYLDQITTQHLTPISFPVEGSIECDEVYIGGKEKWKHRAKHIAGTTGRSVKTKTPVFGLATRPVHDKLGRIIMHSKVYAYAIPKVDKYTVCPIIQKMVRRGSTIFTDECAAYLPLNSLGYDHKVIRHNTHRYVDGDVYTNNIEGFWSHLRRMITGVYHNVSKKYLQNYINEECFRWNNRRSDLFQTLMSSCI